MPPETDREPLVITSRCIVTVRGDGIQLQQPLEAPPAPLAPHELHLLAALSAQPVVALDRVLAEVADQTGVAVADLAPFVRQLRYSLRLMPGPAPEHPSAVDHPSRASTPIFDGDLEDQRRVSLRLPQLLRVHQGRFEIFDHDGHRVAALTPAALHALGTLIDPVTPRDAFARVQAVPMPGQLDEAGLAELLGLLHGAGILTTMAPASPVDESEPVPVAADRDGIIRAVFEGHAAAQDAEERERQVRTGEKRPKVIPVAFDMGTPAGLGMIIACAKAFEGGRLDQAYEFRTDWVWNDERLEELTAEPAIYLFSNYLWSHERCIAISQRIKERSPASITIHGGPDTPKHEHDALAYFAGHPHVDIAIRAEGEVSTTETLAALVGAIGDPEPDLSVLAGVAGISYRGTDGQVVRNPDRDRIADLNTLPSPFLTGLFDVFAAVPDLFVTLETNRGCPYGCTFCDWGSATTSRVRQFDIERVYAELEWCAKTGVTSVSVADANFGMFKRDVEIAQRVADLKRDTGYPHGFGVSYAKNTVKHLQQIIMVLAEAGIMSQGVLSLQSMDEETLTTIHRSNIKTERYDALADEMRHSQLPLMVELMMGLPGQTPASFAGDLQQCIDREVPARINHTTLLVNSPMNEPDYLAEHRIETSAPVGPGLNANVISTASFTRQEYAAMERLRLSFLLYENWGVLRHVSRFVRHETGTREIDFYLSLRSNTEARPEAWPTLYALAFLGTSMMAAPYSWALVMDDLRRYIVSEFGVADDPALESILRTQRALLPAYGRTFPEVVALPHDVIGWNRTLLTAKGSGHRDDWFDVAPRLAEFGPGELTVDDPDHIVDTSIGLNRELTVVGVNWELDSPLSRARIVATQFVDWVTDQVLPQRDAERRRLLEPTPVAAPVKRSSQPVGTGSAGRS
ncbi:MAG: radical SAM protein [Acidimicrobiales bacterium]